MNISVESVTKQLGMLMIRVVQHLLYLLHFSIYFPIYLGFFLVVFSLDQLNKILLSFGVTMTSNNFPHYFCVCSSALPSLLPKQILTPEINYLNSRKNGIFISSSKGFLICIIFKDEKVNL